MIIEILPATAPQPATTTAAKNVSLGISRFSRWAPTYDDHLARHFDVTIPQLALLIIWIASLTVWIVKSYRKCCSASSLPFVSALFGDYFIEPSNESTQSTNGKNEDSSHSTAAADARPEQVDSSTHRTAEVRTTASQNVDLEQCLKQIAIAGLLLFYFFLCDYIKLFSAGERYYSRDTLLFLVFMLLLIGCVFTVKKTEDKVLNRDQTEEWKGWMQVMFVWYHYFAAREWYNWIRVYIACYVWMTGFGNLSFFWVRKDFSALRVAKMLFRLDFLVLLICAAVSNAYMVYYICAMHTYWFLSVYVTMAVLPSWNQSRYRMAAKLVLYAIFNALIFDVYPSTVGRFVFQPLTFVLGLNTKPFRQSEWSDPLYEWQFRVGLDHWACFVGMLCAYNYPYFEALLKRLDSMQNSSGHDIVKWTVTMAMAFFLLLWYWFVGSVSDRYFYNRLHPYTSFIPIVIYVVLRNLSPNLRSHYIGLFAWLGRITLETYLAQLHIYLQSNAKRRIVYLEGSSDTEFYFLNFTLATIIYVAISSKLFSITNVISSYFLPLNDNTKLVKRCSAAIAVVILSSILALIIKASSS